MSDHPYAWIYNALEEVDIYTVRLENGQLVPRVPPNPRPNPETDYDRRQRRAVLDWWATDLIFRHEQLARQQAEAEARAHEHQQKQAFAEARAEYFAQQQARAEAEAAAQRVQQAEAEAQAAAQRQQQAEEEERLESIQAQWRVGGEAFEKSRRDAARQREDAQRQDEANRAANVEEARAERHQQHWQSVLRKARTQEWARKKIEELGEDEVRRRAFSGYVPEDPREQNARHVAEERRKREREAEAQARREVNAQAQEEFMNQPGNRPHRAYWQGVFAKFAERERQEQAGQRYQSRDPRDEAAFETDMRRYFHWIYESLQRGEPWARNFVLIYGREELRRRAGLTPKSPPRWPPGGRNWSGWREQSQQWQQSQQSEQSQRRAEEAEKQRQWRSRREDAQKLEFQRWYEVASQFLADTQAGQERPFPSPLDLGCNNLACVARRNRSALRTCEHSLAQLLRASEASLTKRNLHRERIRWHPDRFSTPARKMHQKAAEELFKILEAIGSNL